MSSADKKKPNGKSGKRDRKAQQRNKEPQQRKAARQEAREHVGAGVKSAEIGSMHAAQAAADIATAGARDQQMAELHAFNGAASVVRNGTATPADVFSPALTASPEIAPVQAPIEHTDVLPMGIPSQLADVRPVAAAASSGVVANVQTVASAYGEYTWKSLEQTRSFVEKLTRVRTLDKAIELQVEFAKQTYETFVGEMQKISGLQSELAKQARRPWEQLIANSVRRAR
jgi:hypothetical protein